MKRGKPFLRGLVLAGAWMLACFAPAAARADDYPTRPVTVTVGYGAGDNMDLLMRVLAKDAEKTLGQPIVIVNKPGAAGAVALTVLARARTDGYEVGAVLDTALARLPAERRLSYKLDDFVPVMQFSSGISGIVVKADSPFKTLPDLVNYAKANPGKVSYTTTGVGSTMDVALQFIRAKAGVDWTHVPYSTARQGLTAVEGGQVTAAVGTTQWVPEVRQGTLRLLAVISDHRMKAFPAVPTIRELGYDFAADSGSMLVVPKGTPAAVVNKLEAAFHQAMQDPQYTKLAASLQAEPVYRSGEQLKPYLAEMQRSFAKTVVDLKIPTELDSK